MSLSRKSNVRSAGLLSILLLVVMSIFTLGVAAPANSLAVTQEATAAELKTAENALGTIVTNGNGLTLYMFDRDVKDSGTSNCNGNCATIWPPATTTNDTPIVEGITGTVATINRADGTKQITLNGYPLYTFNQDTAAGETKGQAVNNIWWAITPAGNPIKPAELKTAENALGTIVTNGNGLTLYMFDRDVKDSGTSNCNGNCATIWPPATTTNDTPIVEGITGTVATINRADGTKQITLNGYPLYTFNQDTAAGETKGQAVNNIWWAITPAGNPIKPAELKTAENALGTIVTNGNGLTLYMFDRDVKDSGTSNCNGNCATIWPPATTTNDTPIVEGITGTVATINRADGTKQITLNGYPLYTFNQDTAAGETKGQAVNNIWWAITPAGNPIKPAPVVDPPKPVEPPTPVTPDTDVDPVVDGTGKPADDSGTVVTQTEELAVTGVSDQLGLFIGAAVVLMLLGALMVHHNLRNKRKTGTS